MNAVPSDAQRRILERLVADAWLVTPPWSRQIQLVATGDLAETVSAATFRVLMRGGWIERISAAHQQTPRYGLSAAGRAALSR
jgi:hypothetical protein